MGCLSSVEHHENVNVIIKRTDVKVIKNHEDVNVIIEREDVKVIKNHEDVNQIIECPVLSQQQLAEIETEIRKEYENIFHIDLVFQSNTENEENLNETRKKLYQKMKNYQGFIVAIKTNFDKYIAYYVPD